MPDMEDMEHMDEDQPPDTQEAPPKTDPGTKARKRFNPFDVTR
jgi:hypothetical protein